MNSYSDVDGVPARRRPLAAHRAAARRVGLRGHRRLRLLGGAVPATMHRVAADSGGRGRAGAGRRHRRRAAGHPRLRPALVDRVRRGELDEELVDRAARRLLTQKVELGLLDPDWTPEASVAGAAGVDLDSPANRALARELAERSIVLLDAGTALPLPARPAALRRVAVVGPCADDPRTFMGCYAFPNHVLPRYPGSGWASRCRPRSTRCGPSCPTPRSSTQPGCAVQRRRPVRLRRPPWPRPATRTSASRSSATWPGCSATAPRARAATPTDLRLPGVQAELLAELLATGTPRGRGRGVRPAVRARRRRTGRAAGLVQAFMPGEEGGGAIAGVLSGRVQPSGRLPVQIPRAPGGQPGTYLQPPLGGAESAGISNLDPTPAVPVRLRPRPTPRSTSTTCGSAPTEVPTDGEFTVTVRVRNTGDRAGEEVVQLYLHDVRRPGHPAGAAAGRVRPGRARARRRRRRPVPPCTPTGPRSPAGTCGGSSSPATSRSSSARPRTTCPAAVRSA